jgi:hypothetical protein
MAEEGEQVSYVPLLGAEWLAIRQRRRVEDPSAGPHAPLPGEDWLRRWDEQAAGNRPIGETSAMARQVSRLRNPLRGVR